MKSESRFTTTGREDELAEVADSREQVGTEVREQVFKQITREALEDIKNNPLLNRLAKGEFDAKQWRIFAVQRYLVARPFEKLLAAAVSKARKQKDTELERALQDNLDDEEAHESWRRDFYEELGIRICFG